MIKISTQDVLTMLTNLSNHNEYFICKILSDNFKDLQINDSLLNTNINIEQAIDLVNELSSSSNCRDLPIVFARNLSTNVDIYLAPKSVVDTNMLTNAYLIAILMPVNTIILDSINKLADPYKKVVQMEYDHHADIYDTYEKLEKYLCNAIFKSIEDKYYDYIVDLDEYEITLVNIKNILEQDIKDSVFPFEDYKFIIDEVTDTLIIYHNMFDREVKLRVATKKYIDIEC